MQARGCGAARATRRNATIDTKQMGMWPLLVTPLLLAPVFPPSVDLFLPGAPMRTVDGVSRRVACYRLPAMIAATNGTVLAFVSARNWTGDGCHPIHPVVSTDKDSMQTLALRRSTDGGSSFGPITQAISGQFVDFQAVWDRDRSRVVVISCFDPASPFAHSCNGGGKARWIQTVSTDMGLSFSTPAPIVGNLKSDQGIQPGAGRALQLRQGRLLFCGHATDAVHGNIAPVWASDNGGDSYTLTAMLPRGLPGNPRWGPDECSLVELSKNGTVRMEARNNWYSQTGHPTKMFFLSTDSGDSWGQQHFDDNLSLDPTCQGGSLSVEATSPSSSSPSSVLLLSGPVSDPRTPAFRGRVNLTVHASLDDGATWASATQVLSGPSGYSSLSELQLPADRNGDDQAQNVGLLFEQADAKLCEPCLPSWKTAPGGCAARGLGAESCKISFVRLPVAGLLPQ